jgi:hypothetical protein
LGCKRHKKKGIRTPSDQSLKQMNSSNKADTPSIATKQIKLHTQLRQQTDVV